MVFRVSTPTDRSPFEAFPILFLGQGINQPTGMEFINLVKDAWNQILAIPPFGQLVALDHSKQAIVAYADQGPGDLGLLQVGGELRVDPAKADNLRSFLASNTVRVHQPAGAVTEVSALDVWPEQGRVGRLGSLVAVLVEGNQPGELYQLTPTELHPVPFVAVVVTGESWVKVIARALAQNLANLADEYELPGPEFLRAPQQLIEPRPNIIVVTEGVRLLLDSQQNPHDHVAFPPGWKAGRTGQIDFHPHDGTEPDLDSSRRANGRIQLVEGGAGYRLNALRCDFDCLMRRRPNSTALPIQVPGLEFCRACFGALEEQVNSWHSSDLGRRARVVLDSQRPLCDTIRWQAPTSRPLTPFDVSVGAHPTWSCHVEPDPSQGLRLSDVRLSDRPAVLGQGNAVLADDPFNAVEQVFERIEFTDLRVRLAGEATPRDLSYADAFANTVAPPELQLLEGSADFDFLGAVRLRLTWNLAVGWSIEAVLSVVFKDKRNDFDPGGAALGNKIFPQISMRYRRSPGTGAVRPAVEELSGTIRLVTSNLLPTDLPVHPELHHFLTGAQEMTCTTDTNVSDTDSVYDWDKEDLARLEADLGNTLLPCVSEDIPPWGVWGATWESGRKLARVIDARVPLTPLGADEYALGAAGAVARRGHLFHGLPGLPHWSWLFDYVRSLRTGTQRFVAVYRQGETTPAGRERRRGA